MADTQQSKSVLKRLAAQKGDHQEEYEERKRCCTVCDSKSLCHVCGTSTQWACSDCRIDLGVKVNVCATQVCRKAHEEKCGARLRERLLAATSVGGVYGAS